MKIDYEEMVNHFTNIYQTIFTEINVLYPNLYEGMIIKYSDEYLKAYSWLQRAGWRLEEMEMMTNFYDEDDFRFFGLEHLLDIRNRIYGYLNSVKIEFDESVYEYDRYDEIFNEFKKERNNETIKKYEYYENKYLQQSDYDMVLNSLIFISSDVGRLKDDIEESKYVNNKHIKKIKKIKRELDNLKKEIEDDM